MKIYNIPNEQNAAQIKQLICLYTECIKLQWSKTIKDIPNDVLDSMDNIEDFINERIDKLCRNATFQYDLSAQEERDLAEILKKRPILRENIGNGVIMNGTQSEIAIKELQHENSCPKGLIDSLSRGGNTIIFG